MRRLTTPLLLFLGAITFLLVTVLHVASPQTSTASDAPTKSLSITLIGDSYTAGNGAGSYNGERGSYQSSKNWGNRYASWLNTQEVKTTLTNLAFSGSVTGDIAKDQVPRVPTNTNLVMLTAG